MLIYIYIYVCILAIYILAYNRQFADDAAAVSSLESENQILLNAFSRWCNWANMIIRVNKCLNSQADPAKTIFKQRVRKTS